MLVMIENSKIMISFVTVVKNDLANLISTIESIRRHAGYEYEHIIIDAESSDGTDEYIKDQSDSRIKYRRGNDKGIYDAMNIGFSLVSINSSWLNFLNAGDLLLSNLNFLKSVDENLSSLIVGSYALIDNIDSKDDSLKFVTPKFLDNYSSCSSMPICHQALIYSRSKFLGYSTVYSIISDYVNLIDHLKEWGYENINYQNNFKIGYLTGGYSYKFEDKRLAELLIFHVRSLNFTHIIYISLRIVKKYMKNLYER